MKKKTTYILLLTITLIAFLNSCTLEKRLYMPGYNVEWKSPNTSLNKAVSENKDCSVLNKDNKILDETVQVVSVQEEDFVPTLTADNNNVIIMPSKTNYNFESVIDVKPSKSKTFEIFYQNRKNILHKKDNYLRENNEITDKGIKNIALIGFFLAITSIGLLLLSVNPIISMILSAAAVILSLTGKHKMSLSHNEIKGKGFAIFGIILGWIGLGSAFFYLLFLSL